MKESNLLILSKLRQKIESRGFMEKFRQNIWDFSRVNRQKLGFVVVFISLLSRMVKSLDVSASELLCFLRADLTLDCRKQSYSDARQKIKWEGYEELNSDLIGSYYDGNSDLKTYKGLLMISIDGSTLCLPNTESLVSYFGAWKNQGICRPLARISRAVDVLNLKVIDAQIAGCMTSEMVLAKRHIPLVGTLLGAETPKLFLFDRNYPSYYWLGYLESLGNKYVVRTKCDGIFRSFAGSGNLDITVEIDVKTLSKNVQNRYFKEEIALGQGTDFPKKFQIRLLKLLGKDGEYILLATNLLDNVLYPYEDFRFVYHCRWGSETDYDKLKNVIQVENFSSITPLGILQEFHSATLVQNIASLVIEEAQLKVDFEQQQAQIERQKIAQEQQQDHEIVPKIQIEKKQEIVETTEYQEGIKKKSTRKQICFAVAFGLIHNEIWNILFFDEPIEIITQRLIEKIRKRTHTTKPDRNFIRKKIRSKAHFNTNKRKVI
jgi:hypothetical protein